MCYNTRNIVTNKKYINANSIGSFSCYQPIQCGKCYECLKAKEREYTHRSDAQYRATIAKGGFCFWETFTYSPDNVPIYWADGRFEHGESNINNLIFKNRYIKKDAGKASYLSHFELYSTNVMSS